MKIERGRLIDCYGFYAVLAIFQPCNGLNVTDFVYLQKAVSILFCLPRKKNQFQFRLPTKKQFQFCLRRKKKIQFRLPTESSFNFVFLHKAVSLLVYVHRYMAEILPLRRKTLSNQSINVCSIDEKEPKIRHIQAIQMASNIM